MPTRLTKTRKQYVYTLRPRFHVGAFARLEGTWTWKRKQKEKFISNVQDQSRLTFYVCDLVEAMSQPVTVVSASTESIQVVVVWPVVNITTEPTWTSTIQVTSYVKDDFLVEIMLMYYRVKSVWDSMFYCDHQNLRNTLMYIQLPQDSESILEANHQPRQALDPSTTRDSWWVHLWLKEGYRSSLRFASSRLLKGSRKGSLARNPNRS